ncbi:hypothetical protein EBZ39_03245 [bacterium]|nr:hypothetical protein [bacterium]
MPRSVKDAELIKVKALPAAAASNNTDSIDLGQLTQEETYFEVELSVPATPALVDTKTITFTFQDSADNSSFAAITGLSTLVLTGAGGAGAAAATRRVRLPAAARRYLRVSAAVETGGGSNVAVSYTLALVF